MIEKEKEKCVMTFHYLNNTVFPRALLRVLDSKIWTNYYGREIHNMIPKYIQSSNIIIIS